MAAQARSQDFWKSARHGRCFPCLSSRAVPHWLPWKRKGQSTRRRSACRSRMAINSGVRHPLAGRQQPHGIGLKMVRSGARGGCVVWSFGRNHMRFSRWRAVTVDPTKSHTSILSGPCASSHPSYLGPPLRDVRFRLVNLFRASVSSRTDQGTLAARTYIPVQTPRSNRRPGSRPGPIVLLWSEYAGGPNDGTGGAASL